MTVYAVRLPLKNQLLETRNGPDDCVPDSFASVVEGLTGRPTSGVELLGLAYPPGYTGFTNPAAFAAVLRGFGVGISYSNAGAGANADMAVNSLKLGEPSMVAIPSNWDADLSQVSPSGFAHMCILADFDTATQQVTLMNPFHGVWLVRSLDWLKSRMAACQYQGIWVCERLIMYWTLLKDAAGVTVGAKGANGEELGSGFASRLEADGKLDLHPAQQGTGEVRFMKDAAGVTLRSFAGFIDGSALFYSKASGPTDADYVGWGQLAWALLELWGLVQNGAALVGQLHTQLGQANAEIAALQAAQPDPNAKRLQAMGAAFDALVKLADQSVAA